MKAAQGAESAQQPGAEQIRVRGIVQGVGFRPMVWRLAQQYGLSGRVLNDGAGVLIEVSGRQIEDFVEALYRHCPPLARIDTVERLPRDGGQSPEGFAIVPSDASAAHTGVAADAATCPECLADVRDPANRRHGYAFTNCTHCGPRLSIIREIPYDRAHTSMADFLMCPACQAEYHDPADRRFHAQPNACPDCGPHIWLEDANGPLHTDKPLALLVEKLASGAIVAIKGIGGFHLACDARNKVAVARLRQRKHRYQKPLAMMARDLDQIRRYCDVDDAEQAALGHRAAPILILHARADTDLAEAIAPGQNTLGFMLPYSSLHQMIMDGLQGPLVMTSGNRSEEPQCIANADAVALLGEIADLFLLHNRDIVNRIDDSVQRQMAGQIRVLRRARGMAPESIPLPPGFEQVSELLALGGELKNTFCLLKDGQAVLSQHMGDLENAATWEDFQGNLGLYQNLYQHQPEALVVDAHPEYLSAKLGRERAESEALTLVEVQHHHAHIAACLGDNHWPQDGGKVLGLALDGLGYGADGGIWGGEFLLADYRGFERLAHFPAVPMFGGAQAMREPWRNTYAHLSSSLDWQAVAEEYADLELIDFLNSKPLKALDAMQLRKINAPLASSAGRYFDAVAAALGVCREQAAYEGQAAIELEALVDDTAMLQNETAYKLVLDEPAVFWTALLDDLRAGVAIARIATGFHRGLAEAVVGKLQQLSEKTGVQTVALSGGVFQNRTLLEQVTTRARATGLDVLLHKNIPANDGGLAFGQALVAAANWRN